MNSDHEEQQRRTLWCGNLAPLVTDELLFELFLQAGPVERVFTPKEKDGKLKGYGFITFKHEESVLYAMQIMDGTTLFGRNLNMKNRTLSAQQQQQRLQHRIHEQYGGGYQQHNYPTPMVGSPVVIDQQAMMQQLMPQMNAYNAAQLLALQGYQAQMNYSMQNNMMPRQQQHHTKPQGSPSTQEYYQNRPEMHERRHGPSPGDDRDRSNSRPHNRHNKSRDKQHRNDRSYHRRRR